MLDWKVSVLGFGTMRLPIIGSDASVIDEPEAIRMIRYAVEHGVNYVDTGYRYHCGKSETVVGKALKNGYRERVKIAAKMPTMLVNSEGDMDKFLNEQLTKLQTDHIDFYLLHGLRKERWEKLRQFKVLSWLEKKESEGKINQIGFSFHDDFPFFKELLDETDEWGMCQIIFNYVDDDFQAGIRGLKYAASKNIPVAVMEPVAGGKLAYPPSKETSEIWEAFPKKRSPAEWALRWVWNHPEVTVVLSGMSTMEQVVENIRLASESAPSCMTDKELATISRAKELYKKLGFVQCRGCQYCMPCPQGVNIPRIMSLYNEFYVNGRTDEIRKKYSELVSPEFGAKNCVRCCKCEELCPQRIPIRNVLSDSVKIFEQSPGRQF